MNDFRLVASIDPTCGIDIAKRMAWGTATMEKDVPDFQNDIVDFNASLRAFSEWPRNVREMHTEKAVGRAVTVLPNLKEKKMLVGIRISEGAEDTWKKVLDGTLRALSIGGHATSSRREFNPKTKKYVNRITGYNLTELSLVDSPADPNCTIHLLTKRNDGKLVASDILSDVTGESRMKNTAVTTVKTFAKGLADGDEVVLFRKSDITEGEAGTDGVKPIMVKSDATIQLISKDDADSLPDDYGGDAGGDNDGNGGNDMSVDLDAIAQNLLEAHDVLHELAGKTECDCKAPDGAAAGGDAGAPAAGGDAPAFKSRNGRGLGLKDVETMIAKAIGADRDSRDQVLAKQIDGLKELIGAGNGSLPRKGNDGGQPFGARALFQKNDGDVPAGGDGGGGGGNGNGAPANETEAIERLTKHLAETAAEAQRLTKMRDTGMTMSAAETIRIHSIGDELGKAKIAYTAATGKSASEITAAATA